MLLAEFEQGANDYLQYEIDYSQWIQAGEVLTTSVATVQDNTPTPLQVSTLLDVSASKVNLIVHGGEPGAYYNILLLTSTDTPQTQEDCISMYIREVCA